jgi:hypothetical protein
LCSFLTFLLYTGVWKTNMNEALSEPIFRSVSTYWERTFVSGLKKDFETFTDDACKCLTAFHDALGGALAAAGVPAERAAALRSPQDAAACAAVAAACDAARQHAAAAQKEASRQVTPGVQEAMHPGYQAGLNEAGQGSHARRTGIVERHVDSSRDKMFKDAVSPVITSLDTLRAELAKQLRDALAALPPALKLQYSPLWEAPDAGAAAARGRLRGPFTTVALEARGARQRLHDAMAENEGCGAAAGGSGAGGASGGGDDDDIEDVTAAAKAARAAALEASRVDLTGIDSDGDDAPIMPLSRAAAAGGSGRVKMEH